MTGRGSSAPRLVIAGYYGCGNAGDEAILAAMLRELRRLRPSLDCAVVSGDPGQTARRHGVRALATADVPGLVRAVQDADLVVLGGGGVFHDYWGVDADAVLTREHAGVSFYSGFPLLAALTDTPCMIYAVGVGPLFGDAARSLTRLAFEVATVATVRDAESLELLRGLGLPGDIARVTADPAFGVPVDAARGQALLRDRGVDGPRVGVCLRNWDVEGAGATWQAHVAAALDEFVRERDAALVFLPFQAARTHPLTDDLGAAEAVVGAMREARRAIVLRDVEEPEDLAAALATCDLVVGMRFHAVVFALQAGVPVVALAYDPKVTGLMARLGLSGFVLDLAGLTPAGLCGAMDKAAAGQRETAAVLAGQVAELGALARANAALAVELLDRPRAPATPPALTAYLKRLALSQAARLDARGEAVRALSGELAERDRQVGALTGQLQAITDSNTWKLARRLSGLRRSLAPPGSLRNRVLRGAVRVAEAFRGRGTLAALAAVGLELAKAARLAGERVRRPRGVFVPRYAEEDNAVVTLYTDDPAVFSEHEPRRAPASRGARRVPVSLIATARNEAAGVERWAAAVLAQSRLPDEIVLVDGGSTDGTLERLQAVAARSPVPVVVLSEPGANIARGRNVAIRRARCPVVAVTDFGGRPRPGWLEALAAPFEDDAELQVVAGWYEPFPGGRPETRRWWSSLEATRPGDFLPSSRSIAFSKSAWESAGGYPEWLTLTGEDTYFALELKRYCSRWAFAPDAVVEWDAPAGFGAYLRKLHGWSVGDGEAGLRGDHYWGTLLRVAVAGAGVVGLLTAGALWGAGAGPALSAALAGAAALPLVVLTVRYRPTSVSEPFAKLAVDVARVAGFVRGARRRREVAARRRAELRGLFVILSGVPIDDTGGGARATQLALELLRQKLAVVFVSRFPKYESVELGLRIVHPNLVTCRLADFDWSALARAHPHLAETGPAAAVVEFPLADFLPVVAASRARGAVVAYDLLDDWNTALGGDWYAAETEQRIIEQSQVLVATAPSLVARLERLAGRPVALLPNAVNDRLFDRHRRYPRPPDLPAAPWTVMYVGALWGSWFDWDLLRRIAERYRDAAVVVIGDYRGQCAGPPPNLHFLGLKPQRELPAYLAAAAVTIVPWRIDAITHATSPLKVYEYLAMGKPVVAPDLPTLRDVPLVLRSRDRADFVDNVGRARETPVDGDLLDRFVRANSWAARVEQLVQLVHRAPRRA